MIKTRKVDDCWIDKNKNRWNIHEYSKKEAKRLSKTLINCFKCYNCVDCKDCSDCNNCKLCGCCVKCNKCIRCNVCCDCEDCVGCSFCSYCADCKDCWFCNNGNFNNDCYDCNRCYSCISCVKCDNCKRCVFCKYINGFEENPARYVTPLIGSRNDNTTFYYSDKKIYVTCGCFRGDLKAFEKAVRKTHKCNKKHFDDYLREIKKVKTLFELEEM